MRYDIVTIVASRRGASQLRELVSRLPADFGTPIVCLALADPALLADLARCTRLRVKVAQAHEQLRPGCIYFPPAGASIVLIEGGRMALSPVDVDASAHHPVDRFLESTARLHGDRALAVVLAAFPDDGAEGAHTLKWRGGTVLVLDRDTAEYYGMADAMVKAGSCDRVLTAGEVANALRASFTGRDLLECAELQFELGQLLDSALRASGTNMGNIQIAERVKDRLHIVVHRGLNKHFLDHFSVVRSDTPSACGRAFLLRRRVVIEDVLIDPQYEAHRDAALEAGYRAVQSTPILGEGHVAGVLSTLYRVPHRLSVHEAKNLDEIAAVARVLVTDLR